MQYGVKGVRAVAARQDLERGGFLRKKWTPTFGAKSQVVMEAVGASYARL